MHPERRVTLDSIRCDNLPPHPLSVKIYGKPKPSEELLTSIEKVGLLQPLIVNDYGDGSYELLSGNTRAEAWRILHKQGKVKSVWISCRFVQLSSVEAERLIIESNRQRTKTPEMKAREFKELKRIETELAKERQATLNNKKTASGQSAVSDKGEAAAKAAVAVGMGANTAKKLEAVVDEADKGNMKAQKALKEVNAGNLSVSGAYRAVAKPKDPEKVKKGVLEAQELTKLFENGEVTRSKREGLFHVMLRDVSSEQVKKLAKVVGR